METISSLIFEGLGMIRMIGINGLISGLEMIRMIIICTENSDWKGGDRRLNQLTRKLAEQPKPLVCRTVDQRIGINWVKSLRSVFVNGCWSRSNINHSITRPGWSPEPFQMSVGVA